MSIQELRNHITTSNAVILCFLILLAHFLHNKFQPTLRDIPGPPLAGYTRLWRFVNVASGKAHLTHIQLHKKYGPLVRLGPSIVSVGDPDEIGRIYDAKESFTKTDFYPIQAGQWKRSVVPNMFSIRDVKIHKDEVRKYTSYYTPTAILQCEQGMDAATQLFLERMSGFASSGESIDVADWIKYYAFDVIGKLTFNKELGFLREGKDIDDALQTIEGFMWYSAIIGQIPEFHKLLFANPLLLALLPPFESWNWTWNFATKQLKEYATIGSDETLKIEKLTGGNDMLSKLLELQRTDPNKLSLVEVINGLNINVLAGTDTTGAAMSAIVYYLCKNPDKMAKLLKEIDTAADNGHLSNPLTYKESITHLPYFQATVKEAMRLHGSIGLILERHVPPPGATICGKYLPPGTTVGINPFVISRNPTLFSPDPSSFRPERWLEASSSSSFTEQLKKMEDVWQFNFGHGSRTCRGRYMALIEIYKFVPEVLRRFELVLVQPEREWEVRDWWMMFQKGVNCTVRRR